MPARDYIKIDRSAPNAMSLNVGLLINYLQSVRKSYELSQQVKGIMDHMTDGTDFTDLEGAFGLPVGKGSVIYSMVQNVIQSTNARTLTESVG